MCRPTSTRNTAREKPDRLLNMHTTVPSAVFGISSDVAVVWRRLCGARGRRTIYTFGVRVCVSVCLPFHFIWYIYVHVRRQACASYEHDMMRLSSSSSSWFSERCASAAFAFSMNGRPAHAAQRLKITLDSLGTRCAFRSPRVRVCHTSRMSMSHSVRPETNNLASHNINTVCSVSIVRYAT